jgi:3-oxoacyl-[acyl-carrier protein] reductase
MNLNDQIVLITGGAGAIGQHLVSTLYKQVKGLVVIDKDEERLQQLAMQYPEVKTYACDLTNGEQVVNIVARIYAENKVSVLINNAGLIHSEPLINIIKPDDRKHSFEAWDITVQSNLYATFYMTACVVDHMVLQKIKGVIISVSSIAAAGNIGQTAYSAAKAGIEAMTVTWAKELGMFGIRTAAIAPGFFDTSSTSAALSEATLNKWKKSVPLNRLGQLEELYTAIHFIITNEYYNGQTLAINGGLRI